jgi:hypothetical protein
MVCQRTAGRSLQNTARFLSQRSICNLSKTLLELQFFQIASFFLLDDSLHIALVPTLHRPSTAAHISDFSVVLDDT